LAGSGTDSLGSLFEEYTALFHLFYFSKSEPRAAMHKQIKIEFEEKYCYGTISCWAGSSFLVE